jgi:hypothetical protein
MLNIHVSARKWFHKGPGNTYHSVSVHVDGVHVGTVPYAYGYGRQYMQTAVEILERTLAHFELPRYPNGNRQALWAWCDDNGVKLVEDVVDVPRKKDLHFEGKGR